MTYLSSYKIRLQPITYDIILFKKKIPPPKEEIAKLYIAEGFLTPDLNATMLKLYMHTIFPSNLFRSPEASKIAYRGWMPIWQEGAYLQVRNPKSIRASHLKFQVDTCELVIFCSHLYRTSHYANRRSESCPARR